MVATILGWAASIQNQQMKRHISSRTPRLVSATLSRGKTTLHSIQHRRRECIWIALLVILNCTGNYFPPIALTTEVLYQDSGVLNERCAHPFS